MPKCAGEVMANEPDCGWHSQTGSENAMTHGARTSHDATERPLGLAHGVDTQSDRHRQASRMDCHTSKQTSAQPQLQAGATLFIAAERALDESAMTAATAALSTPNAG